MSSIQREFDEFYVNGEGNIVCLLELTLAALCRLKRAQKRTTEVREVIWPQPVETE